MKRPPAQPAAGLEEVRLGLTMFRYEPPGSVYRVGGEGTKEIVQEGEEVAPTPPKASAEWQPADWSRATPQTQFAVGQVVRLCFELLTQTGYLYVIVQEQYADGSTGAATLLFPTLKTNGGNNYMQPNQRFWLPRAPSYFRLTPSKSANQHVGELLTVVIASESPDGILPQPLGDKAMPLTPADVTRLTQGSNGEIVQMNLDGGAGQKQTAREAQETSKGVNQEGEEALNEDDPLPQTVYEARRKPGQPVIMRVPLRFKPN